MTMYSYKWLWLTVVELSIPAYFDIIRLSTVRPRVKL